MKEEEVVKKIFSSKKIDEKVNKENIVKLHSIDKSLVPRYLDEMKMEQNKSGKAVGRNDDFLKYLL